MSSKSQAFKNKLLKRSFSTKQQFLSNLNYLSSNPRRVVVTGMGCVSPLGNNLADTWKQVKEGKTGIKHLKQEKYFKDLPKGHCIGAPVDREFFSQNRAFKTLGTDNLVTQITLSSFHEAVQDSGLEKHFLSEDYNKFRVGVVTGTSAPSLNCIVENTRRAIDNRNFNYLDRMGMLKLMTNLLNFNISKVYGFEGPISALSLSCASGLNSVGEGMKTIKNNECDIVICGSSEANLGPFLVHSMNKIGTLFNEPKMEEILSSGDEVIISKYLKGTQRPFDKERKGIVLGEGSGLFILEDYEHAKKRGAKIYCEVMGYSTNGDSFHLTKPKETGKGGFLSMLSALANSNIGADEIDLISCHATSTEAGDIAEMNSITALFGDPSIRNSEGVKQLLYDIVINNSNRKIGKEEYLDSLIKERLEHCNIENLKKLGMMASKTQLAHLLGASGALEIVLALKSMEENIVIDNFNSKKPISSTVNLRNTGSENSFYQSKEINYVLKNSFAFGGVNSSIVFKKITE